jgi:hypothetical protein
MKYKPIIASRNFKKTAKLPFLAKKCPKNGKN